MIAAAMADITAYLTEHCRARRADPRDDLISALVTAEVDGRRLDDEEATNFSMLLLLAGHITTTVLLGNAVRTFDENPGVWDELRADPGPDPRRDRGGAAATAPRSPRSAGLRPARRRDERGDASRRTCSSPRGCWRPTGTRGSTPTRTASTSAVASAAARSWPSGTASTSASAHRWPGWRAGWRWRSSPAATGPCRSTTRRRAALPPGHPRHAGAPGGRHPVKTAS